MAGFAGIGAAVGGRNPIGQANELAAQYKNEGYFDPYGSPRLRALRRRAALIRRNSMRQANAGAAQLYGLDPMQARAAMAQGDVYGNAQTAGDLANADLQTELGQQQFGNSLFMGNLDYARQQALQEQQQRAAQKGAFGQIIGGLAGSALSFIPGRARTQAAPAPQRYSSGYDPYGTDTGF